METRELSVFKLIYTKSEKCWQDYYLQFHDDMMGPQKVILKTACALTEMTDSDIIQVSEKGQFRGQAKIKFIIVKILPSADRERRLRGGAAGRETIFSIK